MSALDSVLSDLQPETRRKIMDMLMFQDIELGPSQQEVMVAYFSIDPDKLENLISVAARDLPDILTELFDVGFPAIMASLDPTKLDTLTELFFTTAHDFFLHAAVAILGSSPGPMTPQFVSYVIEEIDAASINSHQAVQLVKFWDELQKLRNGETLLWSAACYGMSYEVHKLIQWGVSVEETNNLDNQTPLFIAVQNCNVEVVKDLLDHGAKPVADIFGTTPVGVVLALQKSFSTIISLLSANSANYKEEI